MPDQTIDIGLQTPIAAASALKKAGYNVTSGGKPVQVSETDDINQNSPIDYNRVALLMKDNGWRNVNNKFETFEKSRYYKPNMSTEEYAKMMNIWLDNTSMSDMSEGKGDTMLDIFPELNQQVPQEGGEVKDIKTPKTNIKKAEKPKEEKPILKRKETKEVKQINKKKMTETFFTKSELLEAIGGAGSPQVDPGQSPTETPTKPAEPTQRPERKNPFRPKPGVNPKPKGQLPTWISSDALGLGKETTEEINEIQKLINKLI